MRYRVVLLPLLLVAAAPNRALGLLVPTFLLVPRTRTKRSSIIQLGDGQELYSKIVSTNNSASSSSRRAPLLRPYRAAKRWLMEWLWPGSGADLAADEPLPPGSLGCPFMGSDLRAGSTELGAGAFFVDQSKASGHPAVFKCYSRSRSGGPSATAVVVGKKLSQDVFREEFSVLRSNAVPFTAKIVGERSLRFSQDREEHAVLRRLVGEALTPWAVETAIPEIFSIATDVVDGILARSSAGGSSSVRMSDVARRFTLEVAKRLILGLNLDVAEEEVFFDCVTDWIQGLYRPDGARESREYLVKVIEKRVAHLQREGPDGSTISNMVFATTEADADDDTTAGPRRLTHEEVIDNVLLLILAGTDTSSGTITAAVFMLGLHLRVWEDLVDEQLKIIEAHGSVVSGKVLDECRLLDATVREVMRIAPIVSGSARGTRSTLRLAGVQIPSNWAVMYDRWLTHRADPVCMEDGDRHMDAQHGFAPSRWLNEATKPTEYIPFGIGRRHCLGADLAMVEMKIFLICMVRKLDFSLVNWKVGKPVRYKTDTLVLCPEDGVEILARRTVRWPGDDFGSTS